MMSCNPEKCDVIRIINYQKITDDYYSIHGHVLQITDWAKYLSFTIDSKIMKKVKQLLGILEKKHNQLPKNIKETS